VTPSQSGPTDDDDLIDLVEPPPTRCDSCGDDGVDLAPVKRVYVTPGSGEDPDAHQVLDEVEWWCYPCRTHYPHEAQQG
jgi:hypothetical protein